MKPSVYVFDPTASDKQSQVRGIGRYLQILKENFEKEFVFTEKLPTTNYKLQTVFINPFFNLLLPPLVMKRIAHKQIAVIHDLIPLKYPQHFPIGIKGRLNVFLNKLALRNYDIIITDSETSKKDIIKILGLDESKIHIVYPCLPKIFTNSKFQFPISKQTKNSKFKKSTNYQLLTTNYCLYVGDATWNKNLVNLAKAIKIINVTCMFVGKVFENLIIEDRALKIGVENRGLKLEKKYQSSIFNFQQLSSTINRLPSKFNHPWQQEFREFLNEVKDDKRFIFAGFVPDKKLIKLYQQACINILPSRDEGFGFSYLEAASQRCPSVLADIPVLHEISNSQALFANPHNPHEIASAVGEIYFNNDARKSLAEKVYIQSKQFSSTQFRKQFLQTIQ